MKKLEKSVPVIRFKGFSEAWEQRKLGAVAEYYDGTHQTPKYTEYGVPFVSVENINNLKGTNKYISEQNFKSQFKIKPQKNDIFMTRITAGIIGDTAIITDNKPLAYYVSLALIRPNNIIPSYLEKYFNSLHFKNELHKRIIHTAFPKKINLSEIGKCMVSFPLNKYEQEKIGTFFKQLDHTIALHQRKLDALKLMKKGFLQQMFPKIEADIPEIRFADFDGKWEQRKLGEIFNERSERSADGELISVTINSGVVKASKLEKKDNSSFDKSNYKVVKKGDIAYNSMRMWQGASGYSSYDGILSPAYTVIYPRKDIDTIFIAYMFKKIDMIQTFQRNSQGLTSDTWNLKFPSLSTIKIKIPANDEQIKITNLFQKLEYTSILHQNQIEMLKKVKKAYLQTMFI
ncbi:restriction endonuclease subunit S [Listeria monocytogenes]|uniref:restriction endonuclease subunit S n=1 Tax=Listeria monocytogenes TaxID=1639 RepID=UPI0010B93C98|nr:restriction endonuclease subunit S [Listeria monocytogenes]EAC9871039.1 restriction endonuclease subunit S [Listeria monocytogenes]EAE6567609.1 restriction endonuclease subunit S [Listeria monocytogenes]